MVYDYHLTDATLRLVFDPETEKYRLLIANGFRSICLSIEGECPLLELKISFDSNFDQSVTGIDQSNCGNGGAMYFPQRSMLDCRSRLNGHTYI